MSASPSFPDLPSNWVEQTLKADQDRLFVRHWSSNDAVGGRSLFVIHGFGENSNRYRHWPHYLDGVVDTIFAIDLPGHGRSNGQRGDCNSFMDYTGGLARTLQELTPRLRGELHILGHSFGGLCVLTLLKMRELSAFRSVIASAPLLELAMPVPPLKKFFGQLVEPWLGHMSLKNEIDLQILSHDESVAPAYAADPLNNDRITPRTFVEMSRAMASLRQWRGPVDLPFFLLLPLADQLVDWKTSWTFFTELQVTGTGSEIGTGSGIGKKEIHSFPGFFHESFNEKQKGLAFNALSNWLTRKSKN